MGIKRTVYTTVACDTCNENILSWVDSGTGVSKAWATYYARQEGMTVGKKGVKCKACRIADRQKKCAVIKAAGHPGKDEEERCLGYDEAFGNCKKCIAYTGFDWEEEKKKFAF